MAASIQTERKRGAPPEIVELVDISIYTFCCMAGVTQSDKIRGSPIVLGVVAMVFQMLRAAKDSTRKAFQDFDSTSTASNPGKLKTIITSRLKFAQNHWINEKSLPNVPMALFEGEEMMDEENERVVVNAHPRCWRCKNKCRYCQLSASERRNILHFRSELMSPILDIFDHPDNDDTNSDTSSEEDVPGLPEPANDDEIKGMMDNFFQEDFAGDDDDEGDDKDNEEDEDIEMVEDTESEEDS